MFWHCISTAATHSLVTGFSLNLGFEDVECRKQPLARDDTYRPCHLSELLQMALRPVGVHVAGTATWQCLACRNCWAAWFQLIELFAKGTTQFFFVNPNEVTKGLSRYAASIVTYLQNVTVEGENYMIAQQTTRGLLKLVLSPTSSVFVNAWEGQRLNATITYAPRRTHAATGRETLVNVERIDAESSEVNTRPTSTRRASDFRDVKRRLLNIFFQWSCSAKPGEI